jgi:hypothetical protein
MGIEPTSEAWEAPVLPLNYARSLFLIVLVNWILVQEFDSFIQHCSGSACAERKSVG